MTYTVQARGVLKRTKRGISASEIRGLAQRMAEQSGRLRVLLEIQESEEADFHQRALLESLNSEKKGTQ